MPEDKLKQKGRGEENAFFRKQDEQLLAKLRARARAAELGSPLAEKLAVDDPGLLERIKGFGISLETGAAFLLAPLVQVAWAEGKVTKREKRVVLDIARESGIAKASPSYALLEEWLEKPPPSALFDAAVEAVRVGLAVLPEDERAERIERIVGLCHRVAATSGGLAHELGLTSGIDNEEKAVLDVITKRLTVG